MAEQPFSFDDHFQKQLDPFNWAKVKALGLFCEIREVLGDEAARRVFKIWSVPPSAAKLRRIEREGIRDAIELFGRTKGQIARERAHAKHRNPTPEQIDDEKRQLRRKLNKPSRRPKARSGRTKLF